MSKWEGFEIINEGDETSKEVKGEEITKDEKEQDLSDLMN